MLLLWVGLIVLAGLAVWTVLRYGQTGRSPDPSASAQRTALDILRERYARGEITREEYQELRDELAV